MPYRHDLALRLLSAVSRRPNDKTKANIPFANLQEDSYFVKFEFSCSGMRNSSTSPCCVTLVNEKEIYSMINKNRARRTSGVKIITLIACCMKSIAISRPKSSPAMRVNLLIMEQAPKVAIKNSSPAVQTQTLKIEETELIINTDKA